MLSSMPCGCKRGKWQHKKPRAQEPVPNVQAHPSPDNLLEWHFALEGAAETPYARGVYHGKIVFPPQYPFKPPSLTMLTPNGRRAPTAHSCRQTSA